MKKKRMIWIALILMLCLGTAVLSAAFIRRQLTAENLISFGSVNLKLHETFINEQGIEEEFDAGTETDITYDAIQNRIFRVENTGKNPIFVRVSFELCGEDGEGNPFEAQDYMNIELKKNDWVYHDGWYYYQDILEPNTETKELITDIIFNIEEITSNHPGSRYELQIDAQGVQSENNSENALQAAGWPEN